MSVVQFDTTLRQRHSSPVGDGVSFTADVNRPVDHSGVTARVSETEMHFNIQGEITIQDRGNGTKVYRMEVAFDGKDDHQNVTNMTVVAKRYESAHMILEAYAQQLKGLDAEGFEKFKEMNTSTFFKAKVGNMKNGKGVTFYKIDAFATEYLHAFGMQDIGKPHIEFTNEYLEKIKKDALLHDPEKISYRNDAAARDHQFFLREQQKKGKLETE